VATAETEATEAAARTTRPRGPHSPDERPGRLADEQAALRRVATFVAGGPPPDEVFGFVAEEVASLFRAESAAVLRFDPVAETATVVGRYGSFEAAQLGVTFPLEEESATGQVYRTGKPARLDDYAGKRSRLAELVREAGFNTTVAAPVTVGGRLWGTVLASSSRPEPLPPETEERLADFAELVALALASADAREELSRSRARLVAASDTERRRLERNLHDGPQQRLVTLAVTLRLAESRLETDPEAVHDLIVDARDELDQALEELREIARGLHPGVLTARGLAPALESLAARLPIPVRLSVESEGRCVEAVEVAAYYVVAEALANAIRYSEADSVDVEIAIEDGTLSVEVADAGRGGADPAAGTGLRGLADRVETLGGRLEIESPVGAGTRVRATLPTSA
jgi:signal transduction histidine kinase